MIVKILKGFCALSSFFFLLGCTENLPVQNLSETLKVETYAEKTPTIIQEISDEDKLKIIKTIIYSIRVNSNDICHEKQTIYFSTNSFSDYVVDNFPKKINRCETVLMKDNEFREDFKNQHHRFSYWEIQREFVHVTFTTKFPGGNEGGCDHELVKSKEKWIVKSSECWATAS